MNAKKSLISLARTDVLLLLQHDKHALLLSHAFSFLFLAGF